MTYESTIRDASGRLRFPFANLPVLVHLSALPISQQERPALENMRQFMSTMVILAGRLRDSLSRYEEETWVHVPFDVLFVDTQCLVLFLRQFMEDIAFIVRAVLPPALRGQMPAGFTALSERILASGPKQDAALAEACPDGDPLREFLVAEQPWFREIKDLRDDICHRSAYGRLRTATFPGLGDLIRAGGGKAPFASEADLRAYLCGLFTRWLALANVVSEFVDRRMIESGIGIPLPRGFIAEEGEIDFSARTTEPMFPIGTAVMTFSRGALASLEYFLRRS